MAYKFSQVIHVKRKFRIQIGFEYVRLSIQVNLTFSSTTGDEITEPSRQ